MSKAKRYRVVAEVTISMSVDVEASSKAKAKERAREMPVMGLCHYCSSERDEEWCTGGDLDGEPNKIIEVIEL